MPELVERSQVGKREDLADLIAVADAKSTPVTSMLPKGKELTNSLMEWQADNYPAPSFDGVVDNQDVTNFENLASGRARLQNYIQIFERKPKVSRLAENSDVAGLGRKKEMARAITKAITMIKRDTESAICSDDEPQADNGAVGYKTRGLGGFIKATAGTVLPIDSNYLTPAASIDSTAMASVTESIVGDVLESIYNQTGTIKQYICPCGPKFKRRISELSIYQPGVSATIGTLRVYNNDAAERKISAVIDLIEGDFGALELHPSKFLAMDQSSAAQLRRAYVLDMEMLELRYAKMPSFRPLEDQGGGPRGLVESICGLVCHNPLGFGKFAATS